MPRRATFRTIVAVLSLFAAAFVGRVSMGHARVEDGVVIDGVSVDGAEIALPSGEGGLRGPIRIPANAREVVFRFREPAPALSENRLRSRRLRYRLEGHDEGWQDIPASARASLYFLTKNKDMTAAESWQMTGTSPGWRGSVEGSRFVPQECRAVAPPAATNVIFSFLTDGANVVGCVGIDDIVARVERDGSPSREIPFMPLPVSLDGVRPESKVPGWWRPGSRPEMSQLRIRETPQPHAILVIDDDDQSRFGNWGMIESASLTVRPGDRVTLSWTAAYSFGVGGEATARYTALRPGSYTFHAGSFLHEGGTLVDETAIPVVVVAPYHQRREIWAAGVALLTSLGVYAGRAVAARRLRGRLATLEREHALERERSRIARDLHDEVGAGLTQIAMQVEKIRDRIDGAVPADTVGLADAVWRNAADLVRSVDAIVWAVSPEQDTLDRFVAYLVQSTEEFLDAAGLSMRFDVPQNLPAVPLDGTSRHRLFLAVREALHNAVKHSGGTRVTLAVRLDRGSLEITVRDDGQGFDPGRPAAGVGHDGLANIRRRMEEVGGTCTIESAPGRGTEVRLVRPLPIDAPMEEPHHA
jgi:signal transduction histidine kinase